MTKAPALDPFTVFGIEHSFALDEGALEQRYLLLSRECHPDRNRAPGATECAAVLGRAAEINDAWRILRDRWERARVLIELRAPSALRSQQQLDPDFLLDAMEQAEAVALAEPAAAAVLGTKLRHDIERGYQALAQAIASGDFELAARRLHESKYARKALDDLESRL